MIRTGEQYRESIRDGREVWIDGERVKDVTEHPAFKPAVDARARIYDMAHEDATRDVVSYAGDDGERNAISTQLPRTREDLHLGQVFEECTRLVCAQARIVQMPSETAVGIARMRGPPETKAGILRSTVPLWQLSESTMMRTPALNLPHNSYSSSSTNCRS